VNGRRGETTQVRKNHRTPAASRGPAAGVFVPEPERARQLASEGMATRLAAVVDASAEVAGIRARSTKVGITYGRLIAAQQS
jgi:hypothetical protein